MADRIQPRRDTAARWAAANPVLLEGEWGVITDSPSQYKIGDGVTAWNSLPLRGYDGTLVQTTGNGTQTVMSQDATTKALTAQKSYTDSKVKEVADNLTAAEQRIEGEIGELRQETAETYATKTGEHKELTAGFAYEILGDGQATSEMFSFRPTGGSNRNVHDGSARIEVLKGNSVVWNQLVDNNVLANGEINGVVISKNEDGSITFNGTASNSAYYNLANVKIPVGHKVALTGVDNMPSFIFYLNGGIGNALSSSGILTCSNEGTTGVMFLYFKANTTFNNVTIRPKIHYLTKMFGAGNEPTTVEQFYELLPEGVDINAYNEGEIVDANYKSIKTTGFNQWDEQWRNGYYSNKGIFYASDGNLGNQNPIKIVGGAKYNFTKKTITGSGVFQALFYDADMAIIGGYNVVSQNNGVITAPNNASYLNFFIAGVSTYNNDICINIAWDEYSALNGQYKPYKPFERDLSLASKYFPNGMRSAGNVADEIRFNSTTQQWEAVQKVGVRAYQSGDEADTAVTTDGKNTNYALATPDVKTITEDINLAYDVADYGTEQLIVAEGAQSAPLSAEVVYEPNVLASIKQVAAMLTRLDALETAVATMQGSAVAVTNEEG